jgi:NADH dehydrogenase
MTQKLLIAGSGFAGMWAALAAARAAALHDRESELEISVVSPAAELCIRPRLYETAFEEMNPELGPLFAAVGVRHIAASVAAVDPAKHEIGIVETAGKRSTLRYDRFVLATGSTVFTPAVPGLKEHGFNVDQFSDAVTLDRHLHALADEPDSMARNTVVIAGGGFTGIETAADMPQRLRKILGADANIRVVILEQADAIGPDLGPGPRPLIGEALHELGVEVLTSTAAAVIDAGSVTTAAGERIPARTVVWTAGARANLLAAQIPGEHDRFGRVHADRELRAQGVADVFVTGDVAMAATDDAGNTTLMSCQHALSLGRIAGHNAAAELLGLPTMPYSQPKYVTCLDLGPWGAVYTEGWEREVKLERAEAKALKRSINTEWIYPPAADREAAFAAADPAFVVVA